MNEHLEVILMNQVFEDYIKGYHSNFSELDKYAKENGIIGKYYSSIKGRYRKFFEEKGDLDIKKFAIRYYRAKKEMYNSAQMFIEAKRNKEVGCIIGHFFLCYYALFHAMQAVLFLNPYLDNKKVLDLSHNEVKKYFEDFYCKGNNSIMPLEIINLFILLKEYRELYSYTMPFNNPQNVIIKMEHLEYYITLCFQLLSLNSFIIWEVGEGVTLDNSVKEYFENCCYRKDPIKQELIKDDTDKNYWYQFQMYGMDFLPYALGIEHDMDEYGGYDSGVLREVGFKECDSIRMDTFSFVYHAIH